MIDDDFEQLLSEYATGTLPALEHVRVEQRLATDPAARALVDEYRQVAGLLRTMPSLPTLNWDAVAAQISAVVSEADQRPAVLARLNFGWRTWSSAAAALVLVAVGIRGLSHHAPPQVGKPVAVADVSGPQAETAAGPAIADVTIGPSPALAARANSWRYAEGVVSRPSKIIVADRVGRANGVH